MSLCYHLFPVRCDDRDALGADLHARGVQTGIHYHPAIHGHTAWRESDLRYGDLPNAEAWADEVLSLPMHCDLSPNEIDYVADAIRRAALTLRRADQRG